MSKIEKDSFIVISDFHCMEWPIDKIEKYYINNYDKIFVLGDVTDRGPNGNGFGGIYLLQKVKNLVEKYPDRVIYIPGNHDFFLLEYTTLSDQEKQQYSYFQIRNGGYYTYFDLEEIQKYNELEYLKLLKWLTAQPIQYVHEYNGKKYALAHALFNMNLYNENPSATLLDYLKDQLNYQNILWFRKNNNGIYDPKSLPDDSYEMIIGHTPQYTREGINLDLTNNKNQTIKVHCIDNGVFQEGRKLGVYDCYLKEALAEPGQSPNKAIKKESVIKRVKRKRK